MTQSSQTILYTTAETRYGTLLAAFSANGLCSLEFGEDVPSLTRSVGDRFPDATVLADQDALKEPLAAILAFLDDPAQPLNLPLDPQGTPFQHKVWDELANIPTGETRTYAQVAQAIGRPSSVRAVASAVGRNRLAVVIPCHRVIRSDGTLGGFHWGLTRKAALLANEGVTGFKNTAC
ncbi:methylated-DNA--[protein]-cysteine S-methyltransferase [Pseudodesulfovibrio sp.]|uniref:methylated-DNA--[protein]-cysteine S-methyltransferase n=1 Tax=unclassified Pseudodesulfovibrio TaxID=2661612 RepID=UPI003AFFB14A